MPPTFARGDVVLTQFPFTDLTCASVRPALVVSQGLIGQDVVLACISSVVRGASVPDRLAVSPGGIPVGPKSDAAARTVAPQFHLICKFVKFKT